MRRRQLRDATTARHPWLLLWVSCTALLRVGLLLLVGAPRPRHSPSICATVTQLLDNVAKRRRFCPTAVLRPPKRLTLHASGITTHNSRLRMPTGPPPSSTALHLDNITATSKSSARMRCWAWTCSPRRRVRAHGPLRPETGLLGTEVLVLISLLDLWVNNEASLAATSDGMTCANTRNRFKRQQHAPTPKLHDLHLWHRLATSAQLSLTPGCIKPDADRLATASWLQSSACWRVLLERDAEVVRVDATLKRLVAAALGLSLLDDGDHLGLLAASHAQT